VIEPGCATYFIEDIHFTGDPLLEKIDAAHRADVFSGVGGGALLTPRKDPATGDVVAERDIHLGTGVQGYSCSR